MVFQNYALFPHMNVFDNVAFGLKMRKLPKSEIDQKVTEALELVRLVGLEKRFPRELSGGQQQRVAFARAVVVRPRVLLLDEPLSNLDTQLREDMRFELKRLHDALGITTIYVTHDQIEALSLSTKIAVMKDGVVQQYGTPLEIFQSPANDFVAKFVGYANFLTGTVTNVTNDTITMKDDKFGYVVQADRKEQVGSEMPVIGDKVTTTIKPESVLLVPASEAIAENSFDVSVALNDYTGTSTRYELITTEGFEIKASELGYSNYSKGTKMKAVFRKDRVTLIKLCAGGETGEGKM